MFKKIILIACLSPFYLFSQNEFNNKGADIYIQDGALIHIQATLINDNNLTNGSIHNDGTIELTQDFENKANASFTTHSNNSSTSRAVKFVGSGTQYIKGTINNSSTAGFYNLVIDKANSSSNVVMQAPVTVNGSLVFGSSNTTSTYSPSNLFTNNNLKGLLQTYYGSNEYVLSITNGSTDAIAGYPALTIDGAPNTGFVLTSGIRGSSQGGLQRKVANVSSYVFPIGTNTNGFNGVTMNFLSIPSGGADVVGKFNDGSDQGSGYVGQITQQCYGCTPTYPTPDNFGYNRYYTSNPCNSSQPQWLIFEDAILDHGYWSFSSPNTGFEYTIETFPNSAIYEGGNLNPFRTLHYDSTYGFNPTTAVWNTYIDAVSNVDDLLQYTRNTGLCYTGNGIPGGIYTGLGHFMISSSKSNNALPVTLLNLTANPVNSSILVSWSTALEINNKGFYLERSTDAVSWTSIAWINGHNNSTMQQNYSYPDADVQANIRYYYRLRQVDNDEQFEYSDIVSAIINSAIQVKEFVPNPAVGNPDLIITASVDQDIIVDIYSIIGQRVVSQVYSLRKGFNRVTIDTEKLSAGTYSGVVSANSGVFTQKLIIQR